MVEECSLTMLASASFLCANHIPKFSQRDTLKAMINTVLGIFWVLNSI